MTGNRAGDRSHALWAKWRRRLGVGLVAGIPVAAFIMFPGVPARAAVSVTLRSSTRVPFSPPLVVAAGAPVVSSVSPTVGGHGWREHRDHRG
jgi:hypothetical protein